MFGILLIALFIPALLATTIERDGRIIGGRNATSGGYPYQVAIHRSTGGLACGGSIISDRIVLTAAHCDLGSVANYKILAGSLYVYGDANAQLRDVRSFIKHDLYSEAGNGYDIALAEVKAPFFFNIYVKPIKLSTSYWPPSGTVIATGWGQTRGGDSNSLAKFLQTVELKIVPYTECRLRYANFPLNVICTFAPSRGICNGDSGGPIVQKVNGEFIQFGITSFGAEGCANSVYTPSVYTEVSKYSYWIKGSIL